VTSITALQTEQQSGGSGLSAERIELIKRTIAKGATDDELVLFVSRCNQTGLDPFADQIYAIKRWDADSKTEVMKIQVSIHGLRLVADRTGDYAPGADTLFKYDEGGQLVSATAYVMKWVRGEWHEVACTVMYSEYVARKRDGSPTHMWASKPHVMLGKCGESAALRKAFPAETSGLYTTEEMEQADNQQRAVRDVTPPARKRTSSGEPVDVVTGEIVFVEPSRLVGLGGLQPERDLGMMDEYHEHWKTLRSHGWTTAQLIAQYKAALGGASTKFAELNLTDKMQVVKHLRNIVEKLEAEPSSVVAEGVDGANAAEVDF